MLDDCRLHSLAASYGYVMRVMPVKPGPHQRGDLAEIPPPRVTSIGCPVFRQCAVGSGSVSQSSRHGVMSLGGGSHVTRWREGWGGAAGGGGGAAPLTGEPNEAGRRRPQRHGQREHGGCLRRAGLMGVGCNSSVVTSEVTSPSAALVINISVGVLCAVCMYWSYPLPVCQRGSWGSPMIGISAPLMFPCRNLTAVSVAVIPGHC